MPDYRVLVTGSRSWDDDPAIVMALHMAVQEPHSGSVVIVHGACPSGADKTADVWASNNRNLFGGIRTERHPADWSRGKAAGFIRNAEMVSLGADLCLAFIKDNSPGATHCATMAAQAGIPVRRFEA